MGLFVIRRLQLKSVAVWVFYTLFLVTILRGPDLKPCIVEKAAFEISKIEVDETIQLSDDVHKATPEEYVNQMGPGEDGPENELLSDENMDALLKEYEIFIEELDYKPEMAVPKSIIDVPRSQYNKKLNNSLYHRTKIEEEVKMAVNGNPWQPLNDYKSPCWESKIPAEKLTDMYKSNGYYVGPFGSLGKMNRSRRELIDKVQAGAKSRLRCLPYVFILGVTKSGTTDMYEVLLRHPNLVVPATKEPLYWNRMRVRKFRKDIFFPDYLDTFDQLGLDIQTQLSGNNITVAKNLITVDATPNYIWEMFNWADVPANLYRYGQPALITPHTLYALNPNFKFIILMRQPVSRVYSHYLMWRRDNTPEQFHREIMNSTRRFITCFKERGLRHCAYNHKAGKPGQYLSASFYYIYLRDWLQLFPREQFLFIRSEDYYDERKTAMREVEKFLDIGRGNKRYNMSLRFHSPSNPGRSHQPMLEKTKRFLDRLYKPFNAKLSKLLNDNKYLWNT